MRDLLVLIYWQAEPTAETCEWAVNKKKSEQFARSLVQIPAEPKVYSHIKAIIVIYKFIMPLWSVSNERLVIVLSIKKIDEINSLDGRRFEPTT